MSGRNQPRTLDEWMQLVTDCRASGLTDLQWCEMHNISTHTFYNACARLKRNACRIPGKKKDSVIDLTELPARQDVVKVELIGKESEQSSRSVNAVTSPACIQSPSNLDNNHTIEIELNGAQLRVTNDVNPALLSKAIICLRGVVC